MTETEQRATLGLCILAALADGLQDESERGQIQRIASGFSRPGLDLASLYQDVMLQRVDLPHLVLELGSQEAKALAYEMAVCVCCADGPPVEAERQFLARLRAALRLTETQPPVEQRATDLVGAPATTPPAAGLVPEPALDGMILNYAILSGGLELMPQSLATLAIIPVQMRMVYRIGKHYGYELGRAHLRDFLATVGIGLSAQVFEGFARKLMGGIVRGIGGGGLLAGLSRQATGSAIAFATTYALGHAAQQYYAAGRRLSGAELKQVFASLLDRARGLQPQYADQIAQKSAEVTPAALEALVRRES